jgi:aryl-alcohol dehydrogenase-like predicted oxidoreductase
VQQVLASPDPGHEPQVPVMPLVGASSVAQLDESLAALDLQLSAEQRQLLDEAS